MLIPKILTTLKNYNKKLFLNDFIAGSIVVIVAIPLSIAFAIASGVSPDKGLFTAVVAGFLVSVLGGSRVQIGGPSGSFVIIVYSIIQQYGMDGLVITTVLAGIILVVMGLAKLGSWIKFIPYPLVIGFTSGIAIVIFSTQIKDFFGLPIDKIPVDFIAKWSVYISNMNKINIYTTGVAMGALLLIVIWNRFFKKIPGSLIALIAGTVVVQLFDFPVATIGSIYGDIPSSIPMPVFPNVSFELIKNLISPAFVIALLVAIESLLTAVVADGMIGGKHRSNMELIAQGAANIFSPLFGGIPAAGALARTATNIKNGAKTPIAGLTYSFMVLLVMLFFGKWATLIPFPVLAAVLTVVSYHMCEWRTFVSLLKNPKSDVAILFISFFLTVFVDLATAIEIGMILSAFLFMRRMAAVSNVEILNKISTEEEEQDDPLSIAKRKIPESVDIFEINGPFFFGAAHKFKEAIAQIQKKPKIRIIRMRFVPAVDSTGIQNLREVFLDCRKNNILFIISGINPQPLDAFRKSGFAKEIGEENICLDIDQALARANEIINNKKYIW
ncbi:MAG: sodium-independent anion transporter [Spirochaetes bacterium GWB1_36_13]|nr:MAG: sodium-independent anion transporter [Spirochaetes bacterium GWB1_36_13]